MAESGGIRAGKAYVELSLQDKFSKQIDAAAKKLKSVGETITKIGKATLGIGTAITAPLLVAAQRFGAMGDEINKASQRTGVGVEALSALKYAAEQSGASFEDLETGLKKMGKAIFEAEAGSKTARQALAGIGVSIEDLKGLAPDEQFKLIADHLNGVEDAGARAAIAMELFGKGGTRLLPLMAEGAAGIAALEQRARDLGVTLGSARSAAPPPPAAFTAEQTGGIERMTQAIADAAAGSADAQRALAQVNVVARDLQGLSPDEQFRRIANGLSRIKDPAQRSTAAIALFGDAGESLLPVMERGAAGVDALESRARQLGITAGEAARSGFDQLAQTVRAAGNGSGQAREALAAVGLTLKDLQGLSPEQQFARVASSLNTIEDPARRAAAATSLFGAAGRGAAAALSGVTLPSHIVPEDLEAGLNGIAGATSRAAAGSTEARAAIAAVGTTLQQLQGLAPERQFDLIADGLFKIQDPAKRSAAAAELLGSAASSLLPALERDNASIDSLERRARELGGTLGGSTRAGMQQLSQTVRDAASGSRAAQDALAGVGLSVRELQSLTPEQQFQRLASALEQIQDPARRAAAASKLFGASGAAAAELASKIKVPSGVIPADLQAAVDGIGSAMTHAAAGSTSARNALAAVGVTVKQLQGLAPDAQFELVAQGLAKIPDPAARAAVATQLFGKSAAALLPVIAKGRDGIKQLGGDVGQLASTMAAKDAAAATRFKDTLEDVWDQVNAITYAVGAVIAQALQPFLDATARVLANVIRWINQNRTLVLTVLGVGVALVAAGGGLVGLGLSIKALGFALSGITSTFKLIGTAMALLTNPVVLVGAALVALAGYFLYATDAGQQAVAYLSAKFETLKATVNETVGGIADALAAGDIALAAQILWAGLKLAWLQGTQDLQTEWLAFRTAFVQVTAAAFFGALEIWAIVKSSLMTAWENTTAFLGSLWDGFIGVFTDLWNGAVNLVTKGLNTIKGLWDSTFDSDAANKAADQLLEQQEQARAKLEVDRGSKREDDRKNNVDEIRRNEAQTIDDLEKRQKAIQDAADQNLQTDVADAERQKAELQKKLDALRNQAKTEKDTAPPLLPKPKENGAGADLDQIIARRVQVQPAAVGTFDVRAVQSLRGDPTQAKIEKNTADAAKSLKTISQKKNVYT